MQIVELFPFEQTDEIRQRYEAWISGMVHKDVADVRNDPVAFVHPTKPLAECRLGLVSTGGIHLRSQQPFDIVDPDGDWTVREIPTATPAAEIAITHSHYNHTDADEDINCIFPIERLHDLVAAGFLGSLTDVFFGMMGFIPNGTHVSDDAAPQIVQRLSEEGAEVVLLSAG